MIKILNFIQNFLFNQTEYTILGYIESDKH